MNLKKILHFSIGPIGAAALGILTVPMLTWSFSVEDIGRFSILQIIMSFSCVLLTLGLDQAYVREYNESIDQGTLFKTVLGASLGFSCIFITLCLFNIKFISEYGYQVSSVFLSWMTILCVILTILLRYISLSIRMQEKGLLYSVSQIFPKIFLLFAIIYFYLIGQKNLDFYHLITIQVLSLFFVFIIFVFFIKDNIFQLIYSKFDFLLFKKLLNFGFPLVISGLVFWLMQSCSRLALLKFSTLKEVGLFGVAISIAAGFSVLTAVFNTIWVPVIYKLVKDGKGVVEVERISEYIALLISIIIFFFCLVMPVIPRFLPASYDGIEYIILLCIMQPLFYTLSEATAVGILIKRKTNYSILISLLGLVTNLIFLIVLVPAYGALGAAISISISFWLYFIFRTELSIILWEKFKKAKIYLSTLLSLAFVVLVAIRYLDYLYIVFGALILFIANVIIFREIFKNILINVIYFFKSK